MNTSIIAEKMPPSACKDLVVSLQYFDGKDNNTFIKMHSCLKSISFRY